MQCGILPAASATPFPAGTSDPGWVLYQNSKNFPGVSGRPDLLWPPLFPPGKFSAFFDDLGFYKILFSVSDRNVLNDYWREKLEPVITYDKIHKSCCLETLYQYLICSGSIQKIAEAMYCHRNTVNYRVRILRETLGLHLDNVQDRFELLAAFYVRSFCDPGF